MKVIQVIDSLKVGGAQKLMTVFAREMLRKGHIVEVVALCAVDDDSPVFRELKALNVPITGIPLHSLFDISGFFRLKDFIDKGNPDVVHTQLNYANVQGTLAARQAGIPSVASLHNASVHLRHYKPYRTWLETRILDRYSRRIIACSYTVARVQQPRFNRKKLVVISNPVPDMTTVPADQVQALRREFLPEGVGILLISVGRLIPEKGYSDLIRVFKLVKEQYAFPVRLLIAGKGYLMDSLRAEAAKAGNEDGIIFLGERNDIPALLAASDIYAGASNHEGQSLAVLEAMQSGLPIVVTDVGDNRRVVAKNCGYVLPAGDVRGLADNIVYLAQYPQERSRMGENAARYVKANYSPEVWVDHLLDLYDEVLHG